MEVQFDGSCKPFLSYSAMETYRQSSDNKKTEFFLFYIRDVFQKTLKIAPVNSMNTDCFALKERRNQLVVECRMIRATIEDGNIHLHLHKDFKDSLENVPLLSWEGLNNENKLSELKIKERVVCHFEDNANTNILLYTNFLKILVSSQLTQKQTSQKAQKNCVIC